MTTAVASRFVNSNRFTLIAASALAVVSITGFVAISSMRSTSAPKAKHASHGAVNSPSVQDPFASSGSSTLGSPDGTISVPGVEGAITPEQAAGSRAGAADTSSGLGFDREAVGSEIVAVTDPLPSSLSLPKGAKLIGNAVRYPNGVVEWRFTVTGMKYDAGVTFMKQALATNGWTTTSDVAQPDLDLPNVGVMSSHLIYAKAAGWQGFATVSAKTGMDGIQVQINLQRG